MVCSVLESTDGPQKNYKVKSGKKGHARVSHGIPGINHTALGLPTENRVDGRVEGRTWERWRKN